MASILYKNEKKDVENVACPGDDLKNKKISIACHKISGFSRWGSDFSRWCTVKWL